jgi:hypothetical protein
LTASRRAALDTNVLLLRLAAAADPTLLRRFKRVQVFEPEDIHLLSTTLRPFRHILTTPHVLAEASNFIDQAPAYARTKLIAAFQRFVRESEEQYRAAVELCVREEFSLLGLSDTGLSELSQTATVITTDYRLAGKIRSIGGSAINFDKLRSDRLLNSR